MVNASGTSSQLTPNRAEPKPAECPPDNKLPENVKRTEELTPWAN
jgi:hypothetical protein